MKTLPLLILLSQITNSAVKPVKYTANRILFLLAQERVILSGETKTSYEEILVEADSVEYELGTKQITAYGSPVLHDGDQTIEGEFMQYNVETGKGTILNAKTEISRGFFEGAKLKKVGEEILNVSQGSFTTCDREEPHYYFKSWKMRIYVNDMVLCQPVVLYIQGIPILVVPFWFFPIRKERHSGFLTPRLGRDSQEGRYVKNLAYYQVINDYADATLTLDYMELVGFRLMAEGLYIVRPWMSGGIISSFLDDKRVKKRRWSINLSHRQKWGEGYSLLVQGNFISNSSYYREYSENLPERMTKTLDSYIAFSKSLKTSSLSLVAHEKRDLESNTSTSVLPKLSYSLLPMELVNSIYFSYSGLLTNRCLSGSYPTQTLQNTVKLNTKQRLMNWLNLTPSLGHSEVWKRNEKRDATSSIGVGVNTNIYGISTRSISKLEGVRHVITPSLNYNLSVRGKDVTERVRFNLRNTIQLKLVNIGKFDLFTTTTSGSYNLREHKFSTLITGIKINPFSPFDLSIDFGYDVYDREIDYLNGTFRTFLRRRFNESHRFNLSLTQSYLRRRGEDPNVQIWGELAFNLTKNWFISYRSRYDFMERRSVSHSLKLIRDLHCWVAELNVESTKVNWKYDFRISIKAMPEISLKKGFFSLFLP